MRPYKLRAPVQQIDQKEALGQLGGASDLEQDVALCPLQTIEPVFRRMLPKDKPILEAGAGRGRWVLHLRRLGYDVTGIDIAESDVAFGLKHDPTVPLEIRDVLRTGFADGSFGAVISLGVVEHFEEGPQAAFAEVRRVLQPGGLFFVTVPTRNLLRDLVVHRLKDLKRWIRQLRGARYAFDEYRYSRTEFTMLLSRNGFEIIEMHGDDFVPPRSMGMYTDIGLLQDGAERWQLNRFGRILRAALDRFSPRLHCSGTLWVCRVHDSHRGSP
ncbi:MAG: class I SAM-dependent methyltransferase [Bacteroidetes bacterium]|nr:class I SAM-dependent methyltransferase [Bacteroidota bacterium]